MTRLASTTWRSRPLLEQRSAPATTGNALQEGPRRRTRCIGAFRRPRACLRRPSVTLLIPRDAMREDSRRRTSYTGAPSTPRASLRAPRGAMQEVSRRRTSCTGAPWTRRAALRAPRAAILENPRPPASPGAPRGVRRRRNRRRGAADGGRRGFAASRAPAHVGAGGDGKPAGQCRSTRALGQWDADPDVGELQAPGSTALAA